MKLDSHKRCRWGIPIGGAGIALAAALLLMQHFVGTEVAKFIPIACFFPVALLPLLVSYLPVECPKCGRKLNIHP